MNIAFFSHKSVYNNDVLGGAETSISLLAEKLAKLGHNVFYLTERADLKENEFLEMTANSLTVISFTPYGKLKAKKRLNRYLKKVGVKKFNSVTYMKNVFGSILENKNIDIVYLFYESEPLEAFLGLRNQLNFKIVMRMAGLRWYEECKKNPNNIPIYSRLFSSVDAINYLTASSIALTHQKAEEVKLDLSPQYEFVADIGVRSSVITKDDPHSEKPEIFKLIMIARFSDYQKKQSILIEAINLLKDRLPLKLTFVGEGEKRKEAERQVEQLGLNHLISFKNFVPQEQLWNEMEEADLLCHACEYEGVSKVIIESMTLGLPVLASNVLPLPDYVKHGVSGFLVNNTPENWALEIENIYKHFDKTNDVVANALTQMSEEFNLEKNTKKYERNFSEIVNGTTN